MTETAAAPKQVDAVLVRTLWLVTLVWLLLNVLGMITLDYGRQARLTLICTFAYVVGLGLFVARRGTQRPTRLQRAILLAAPLLSVIIANVLADVLIGH